MKTIELSDNDASARAVREGQVEDVVVTRDGQPVAIIVPFDRDDLEWYGREREPAFIESIAKARAQVQSGAVVSHEDLKRQLRT
jgi:antitoxin (DNA-binding transcriptional repressor) of toxin-antitoxin stability system